MLTRQEWRDRARELNLGDALFQAFERLGWRLQAVASAAAPALDCALGNVVTCTLGQAPTWAAPTNVPPPGEQVTVILTQDGTGGWAVAWDTAYVFATAWSNTGNTAGKKSTVVFVSDGSRLVSRGANSWY